MSSNINTVSQKGEDEAMEIVDNRAFLTTAFAAKREMFTMLYI